MNIGPLLVLVDHPTEEIQRRVSLILGYLLSESGAEEGEGIVHLLDWSIMRLSSLALNQAVGGGAVSCLIPLMKREDAKEVFVERGGVRHVTLVLNKLVFLFLIIFLILSLG